MNAFIGGFLLGWLMAGLLGVVMIMGGTRVTCHALVDALIRRKTGRHPMTWGDFKYKVEAAGVPDDMLVYEIVTYVEPEVDDLWVDKGVLGFWVVPSSSWRVANNTSGGKE